MSNVDALNDQRGNVMANLQPGDLVIVLSVPPALLANLPEDDQVAIRSVVGKPAKFAGMAYGQAEIEFKDERGDDHTIWIDADEIKPAWPVSARAERRGSARCARRIRRSTSASKQNL